MNAPSAPGPAVAGAMDHLALCRIFDRVFLPTENTRLVHGGDEPVYLPADPHCPWHRVVFRHDYASSALHEVAHWCIAGSQRRLLMDYGYWYSPDGRSTGRQAQFERVEARPQALEWVFSRACGIPFRPSIDNLDGAPADSHGFARSILCEAHQLCREGLPVRAGRFLSALADHSGLGRELHEADFRLDPAWLA